MTIYQTSKLMFRDDYSDAMTADEIIISEQPLGINTGLVDEYGNPIIKQYLKEPLGFHLGASNG